MTVTLIKRTCLDNVCYLPAKLFSLSLVLCVTRHSSLRKGGRGLCWGGPLCPSLFGTFDAKRIEPSKIVGPPSAGTMGGGKGSIGGAPKILPRLTLGPEVTRTPHSAKTENGIVGIRVSRGFRKVIICHAFGENFV